MAFPAVASVATGTSAGTGVVNIAAPSGLATGDLMLAYIAGNTNGAGTNISPPAGWTTLLSSSDATRQVTSYWKVATAGDVAAGTFAFSYNTNVNSASSARGGIARITGADATTPINASNGANGSGTAASSSGITPNRQCLLIMLVGGASAGGSTTSGYAVANNNPSWTESYDISGNGSGGSNFDAVALAWANETGGANTATGSASATFIGSQSLWDLQIIAIQAPAIIATSLVMQGAINQPTFVRKILAAALHYAATLGAAVVPTPVKKWVNQARHASSATNLPKS